PFAETLDLGQMAAVLGADRPISLAHRRDLRERADQSPLGDVVAPEEG
nr:hypothetical protein [Tanacetum cinerariifolium]